ncbi:MAG: DUF5615 family PIN-like protein, partial [Chloroflexota bacterium]
MKLPLLIDEDVPDSVSQVFRDHGHDVCLVRDILGRRTPDQVIATVGDTLERIIVTWNVRDFKKFAARRQSDQLRLRRLGRINFMCPESQGAIRAEQMMRRIEFEFEECQRH